MKRLVSRSRIILPYTQRWSEPPQPNRESALPKPTICLVLMRYGRAIGLREITFWGCCCRTPRFLRFPDQYYRPHQAGELGAALPDCCFLGKPLILDAEVPKWMSLARPETLPKQIYS